MEGYISEIRMFGATFAPRGWFFCQGQLLGISQYTALFALIGTTYGGNGQNTFALPDYRGRSAVGTGNGSGLTPIVQGQAAGSEQVTILQTQMPAHTHQLRASSTATSKSPNGAMSAFSSGGSIYGTANDQVMNQATVGIAGGSQPLPVRNPYLGTNFIICAEGIFPSRN